MDYLTLDEAKNFTGKSESTLRRLVKKRLGSKKKSEFIKTRKLRNGGYQYLIRRDLLIKKYGVDWSSDQHTNDLSNDSTTLSTSSHNEETSPISILKQYIQTLEKQLDVKDAQISEKDQQLNELIERDRENHLLLEKINEALIRFKIPEYIDAQLVSYSENKETDSKEEPPTNSSEFSEEPTKKPRDMGTFSDWLNDFR